MTRNYYVVCCKNKYGNLKYLSLSTEHNGFYWGSDEFRAYGWFDKGVAESAIDLYRNKRPFLSQITVTIKVKPIK